jgi:hypothetical protein
VLWKGVDLKPSSSGASRVVSVSVAALATFTVQEKDVGINDPVGLNPAGTAFDPSAFTILTAWAKLR